MSEKRVVIHRNRLFVPNEAFIVSQASHLKRYRALLSGLDVARGSQLHGGLERAVLAEISSWSAVWSAAMKVTRIPPLPLLRAIRRFDPDLLHIHFGGDALLSLPLAARVGVPFIVTFHGYDVNERASSSVAAAVYTALRPKVFRRAARIIAVSGFLAKRLIEAGCPPEKIVRHSIGVDTAYFSRRSPPDREPTIAFVGRLIDFKGCSVLLDAVRQLDRPGLKLAIVGSGPEEEGLRAFAAAHRIAAEFLGAGSPGLVRSVLERASIFCLPTFVSADGHEESLSIVALEAQSMGVPVVSTTVGGVPEAVSDGESGILVPPRDVAATAAALARLLDDPALRSRMGDAGRRHVATKFDIVTQTAELERIYDSVAER